MLCLSYGPAVGCLGLRARWSPFDNKERPVGGQSARVWRAAVRTEHTTTAYISSTNPVAVLLIMCQALYMGSQRMDSIARRFFNIAEMFDTFHKRCVVILVVCPDS